MLKVAAENYPNPFNEITTITFSIPTSDRARPVSLTVFDLEGREVRTLLNRMEPAGVKFVTFLAGDLASGVYFYKLQSGEHVAVKKLLILR